MARANLFAREQEGKIRRYHGQVELVRATRARRIRVARTNGGTDKLCLSVSEKDRAGATTDKHPPEADKSLSVPPEGSIRDLICAAFGLLFPE